MTEKRFRMETIGDVMLPCIVDNSTAKKESDTITTYHTYETHRKEKCLELVDLLNDFSEENKQLKIRFNEEREKSLKFCRNIDTLINTIFKKLPDGEMIYAEDDVTDESVRSITQEIIREKILII